MFEISPTLKLPVARDTYIQRLRSRGVIETNRDGIVASGLLFD